LVDVHPENLNFDPAVIQSAHAPAVKALIVSHLHGGMSPMRELMETSRSLGLSVVEDACQCPGATIEGRMAGTWGDAGVLSFGGSKLLTAGRGGAILTGRADVRQRIKLYCERGNHAFPLSELQAAVLLPQLEKLPQRNLLRRQSADYLLERVRSIPGLHALQNRSPDSQPGYYKLAWLYLAEKLGDRPRDEFIAAMQAEGVAIGAGFRDFSRRSLRRCRHAGELTNARRAGDTMVVLHHPVLLGGQSALSQVDAALRKVATALPSSPTIKTISGIRERWQAEMPDDP
jgi:dTDP-4-amino-4,6-dideoxygalactose transaminase